MADHKPETISCASMLYESLRIARVPDRLALNAYKEVHEMAGTNVDTRLDSMNKKLEDLSVTLRWSVIVFISLFGIVVTVISVLAGMIMNR